MRPAQPATGSACLIAAASLALGACIDLHPPSRVGDDQSASTGEDGDGTDAADADDTEPDVDADDTDAEDDGDDAPLAGCGWGPTGDDNVPFGYTCGGEGEDPAGTFGLACPRGTVADAPCGEITGVGCCVDDTLYYCTGVGDGATLYAIECGPSSS